MVQDGVEWFGGMCSKTITVQLAGTPISPTITSLKIDNADPNQTQGFTGTVKMSGNQSNQGGSNWYNPMKITLNANQGSNPIANYYVAFYDKTIGQLTNSPTFLSDIQSKLNSNSKAGFLLRYGSGKYYVWNPSIKNWFDITGLTRGQRICGSAGCDTQTYYTAAPGNSFGDPANPNLPNSWNILFDQNFGSKNMYTAGYVVDNNNLSNFKADINPQ